ncbi:amidohydrolase family protein [Ruminococcaceae bacterium OttesenSCG-928-A11]|nr:amidohydrolase family protein [Ruminococcaceae bacterium OttesenSCG-928-A11]
MSNPPQSCDILIKNARYLDADCAVQAAGCIAVENGAIVHIGAAEGWQGRQTLDGGGLLWMPGLVDGHTHTSQQLLRGRLLDEKPVIWKRINVPFEAQLTEETSALSAALCALEMIRSGTTGFIDAGGKYVSAFAEVYAKAGLRGRLSCMTNDNPHFPEALRVDVKTGLARQVELHRALAQSGSLLEGVFSVTALTAASEGLIREIFACAKAEGIATEVHMNEYASEVYDFIERYGLRPFEWLAQEGLIGGRFTAAHGIFLSPAEIEIVLAHGVRVMHYPFSNCGKGVPPTPQLLARGATVGLGSDGSAHGGVDLFREMRLLRGVMNAKHGIETADCQVMPAESLLRMATAGGAAALDVAGLGVLVPGAPADMIAIGVDAPHLFPTQNLVHTLVESACGSDVRHMLVGGKLVMKDREVLTLDQERILHEAGQLAASGRFYWA